MSEDGGKIKGGPVAEGGAASCEPVNPQHYYYGTFQGVANYAQPVSLPQPSPPVIGFPQPVPPPASSVAPSHYYHTGYQTVPGYAVTEGGLVREPRLPCCGLGIGWLLFVAGFLLGAIPWYLGAFLLLCVRLDYREKPGLIACTLAGIISLIAITLGVTKASYAW